MPVSTPFNVLSGGASPTSGQLVTGTLTGLNGQTIVGDANGAWAVTANGTNQNITLTPSGTGKLVSGNTAIFTSGGNSLIDSTAGSLNFRTNTASNITFQYNNSTSMQITGLHTLFGGLTADGVGVIQLPAATTSAGGITAGTDTLLFRVSAGVWGLGGTANPSKIVFLNSGSTSGASFITDSAGAFDFNTNGTIRLQSGGATSLTLDGSQNALFSSGSNGQSLNVKHLTELTTIAAAATTTTTIQMPAGSIVLSVSVRVTTLIPTATSFSVGDAGSATRFSTANVSTAATSTDPGTKAGAYYNASATGIVLTMNGGTPADNSGRVRVTIAYLDCTVPTS